MVRARRRRLWRAGPLTASPPRVRVQARLAGPRAFERSVVDVGFGLLLVAMLLAQVVFKTATETLLYLVQPCHLVCLACAVMLLRPRPWMAPLTNALLPWMMGAWAAILMPDTEELKMPYEVEIFFLEHALVRVVPRRAMGERLRGKAGCRRGRASARQPKHTRHQPMSCSGGAAAAI